MDIKNDIEKIILWKIGYGMASFWWDNWTEKGDLANFVQNQHTPKKTRVHEFF